MDITEFRSLNDVSKLTVIKHGFLINFMPNSMAFMLSEFETDNYRCQALSEVMNNFNKYYYWASVMEILDLFKDENRRVQALEAMNSILHTEKPEELIEILKSFSSPNRRFEAMKVMMKRGCGHQLFTSVSDIVMLFVNTSYLGKAGELLSEYEEPEPTTPKDKQKDKSNIEESEDEGIVIDGDFDGDSLDNIPGVISSKQVCVSHTQTQNGNSKTNSITVKGTDINDMSKMALNTLIGIESSRRPINVVGLMVGEMQRDNTNIVSYGTARLLSERISSTSKEKKKISINGVKGLPTEFVAKEQHKREVEDITDDTPDEKRCTVCWEALRTYHLSPCNHVCLCTNCALTVCKSNKSCPICRATIKKVNYVILS
jgi:hypothetical protein